MKEYTLELYRADARIKAKRYSKNKNGLRFVVAEDFDLCTKDYISTVAEAKRKLGFVVEVFETFVVQKNLMTGTTFKERYDTPYFCSPSSESFWSM
jgi:hypothetical protein